MSQEFQILSKPKPMELMNGWPYWTIETSLGKMSIWDEGVAQDAADCLNKHVEGDARHGKSGRFMNLYKIDKVIDAPTVEKVSSSLTPETLSPSQPAAAVDWDAKERRIVRQACLKAAVEYAASDAEVVTSAILCIAEEFEAWVYR